MNYWFTSDTHWNHKNIVRGTSTWNRMEDEGSSHTKLRDFDTLEEHNLHMINNFNNKVKYDDVLWHLGDWSFGGHENIKKFRDQLHCREIHLIFGNHDQHIEPINSSYRELFASVQYVKELKINQNKFFLSHYSHQIWNKSHKGTIHLFGHSHGNLKGIGRSMDVGVDTNNLYPYHLNDVLEIMKKKNVEIIDHHSQNTN